MLPRLTVLSAAEIPPEARLRPVGTVRSSAWAGNLAATSGTRRGNAKQLSLGATES